MEASADTMESDINATIAFVVGSNGAFTSAYIGLRKIEKAHTDLEAECSVADRKLHEAESSSSSLKGQLKAKQEELKGTTISHSK